MSSWLGATILFGGFLALLKGLRLVERGRDTLDIVRDSLAKLGDRTLDDEAKEHAMREYSWRLLARFGILALLGGVAVFLPLGCLWAADRLGWLRLDAILATAISWTFLGLSGAVTVIVFWISARKPKPVRKPQRFEINYSAADRLLHQMAFATTSMQTALSALEDRLYRRRIAAVPEIHPIFICGLPRAGTTLLLDLCARQQGVVTHTYRDMPFLHVPLLWHGLAGAFRSSARARERAHGDGMTIDMDSPEALEESLWIGFWASHYEQRSIEPWLARDSNESFLRFLLQHMRKLAVVRPAAGPAKVVRYASKNNMNIARIGWLTRAIPEARIVVPFREPMQHAASLRRQHLNFLDLHRQDDFGRQYMAAIGHFDFGANLRPINFDGWFSRAPSADPLQLDFWLRYWIAAHRHILQHAGGRVGVIGYDALCAAPRRGLERLGDFLRLDDGEGFAAAEGAIRAPHPHQVDESGIPAPLLAEARDLFAQLNSRSLV